MNNLEQSNQNENINEILKRYKETHGESLLQNDTAVPPIANTYSIPKPTNPINEDIEYVMAKETDPDLITTYEIVKLPSRGLFYADGLSEVAVEYMTSKDEDMLTTPSLIESGAILDILLKRKIKTKGVNPENLLIGDRNAIILFLRTSSYGSEYTVQVTDPRTGKPFKTTVDLTKLKYKEIKEFPDSNGYFKVHIPMRDKDVLFKLLTSGEETRLQKKAEALQEAYGQEYTQYSTMKLKASIVSIGGNSDRTYIDKFVDAMPALDAYTIRKKIMEVSPDVDMAYEFETKDHYKFVANLVIGVDFFFPSI